MRWGGQGEAGRTAAAALLALASAGLGACVDKADQPRPVAQGDPARGLVVIEAVGCAACHKIPGVAWPEGRSGGDLAGFGARPSSPGACRTSPAS
ncbi:hypothetical protein [Brevundimonas aurantiaca]|uniref:hypothetical protein n=1 Tax=Brevundimonas aurantiaca TaxID=74316 RepID=UPI001CD3D84D|nr:hypothetical protein [Brevundimonas aurantiaca]